MLEVNLCLWQNVEFENLGGKMMHVFKCRGYILEGEKVCLTAWFHKLLRLLANAPLLSFQTTLDCFGNP